MDVEKLRNFKIIRIILLQRFTRSERINKMTVESRTEQIFILTCDLRNTERILTVQEIDKVRVPNSLVNLNQSYILQFQLLHRVTVI